MHNMRIARFRSGGQLGWGSVIGDQIAPLDLPEGLRTCEAAIFELDADELQSALTRASRGAARIPLEQAELLAPVPAPGKIIAIGLNYRDHIEESGLEPPAVPTVFAKFPSSIAGPYDPVHRPRVSSALDYEGELAVVIGRRARHVPRERAREVIAGYMVLNDVSVRDWQLKSPQWSLAKSFDTHTPVGPWLTLSTAVEADDLAIETYVNGELRQRSSTRHLVYDCADLIEYLSQACTLHPGDIIATGTPAGVGGAMSPPVYLVPGDQVRVTIEGLGTIENTVVDEPATTAVIGEERLLADADASLATDLI